MVKHGPDGASEEMLECATNTTEQTIECKEWLLPRSEPVADAAMAAGAAVRAGDVLLVLGH